MPSDILDYLNLTMSSLLLSRNDRECWVVMIHVMAEAPLFKTMCMLHPKFTSCVLFMISEGTGIIARRQSCTKRPCPYPPRIQPCNAGNGVSRNQDGPDTT
ncbi:hypothetical protein IF2G_02066 [Cordyceps javanica]|nr:hypothetical protein IF2G_02066 [Cordyceps javanica]